MEVSRYCPVKREVYKMRVHMNGGSRPEIVARDAWHELIVAHPVDPGEDMPFLVCRFCAVADTAKSWAEALHATT